MLQIINQEVASRPLDENDKEPYFEKIDTVVFKRILSFLTPKEASSLLTVNKKWFQHLIDNSFWRPYGHSSFDELKKVANRLNGLYLEEYLSNPNIIEETHAKLQNNPERIDELATSIFEREIPVQGKKLNAAVYIECGIITRDNGPNLHYSLLFYLINDATKPLIITGHLNPETIALFEEKERHLQDYLSPQARPLIESGHLTAEQAASFACETCLYHFTQETLRPYIESGLLTAEQAADCTSVEELFASVNEAALQDAHSLPQLDFSSLRYIGQFAPYPFYGE